MMGIELNAQVCTQVMIKNLQNMHEKSLPPTGARRRMELEYQDWARLQGRAPHTGGRSDRLVGLVGLRHGGCVCGGVNGRPHKGPPVDST